MVVTGTWFPSLFRLVLDGIHMGMNLYQSVKGPFGWSCWRFTWQEKFFKKCVQRISSIISDFILSHSHCLAQLQWSTKWGNITWYYDTNDYNRRMKITILNVHLNGQVWYRIYYGKYYYIFYVFNIMWTRRKACQDLIFHSITYYFTNHYPVLLFSHHLLCCTVIRSC